MPIRAVLFDFMGTCLDWHSSIVSTLPLEVSEKQKSDFALLWRQEYFNINATRVEANLPPEDFDLTLHKALDKALKKPGFEAFQANITQTTKNNLVSNWHGQEAWPEVHDALFRVKSKGYEVFVHANGTTRLQLDLCKSSRLHLNFDMLFSSEMLGYIKPAPEAYQKCLEMIRRKPEECVMVAAHAYDTRGAKALGMKTVYVHRWTDDILEDQEVVKGEHDVYLEDGMMRLAEAVEFLDSGASLLTAEERRIQIEQYNESP